MGLGLAAGMLGAAPAHAADEFFPVYNQGSLARAHALPALGNAQVLAHDTDAFYSAADLSNEYYTDANAREFILEDGETTRASLTWTHGVTTGVEFSATVPVLIQGGGFLDHTIEEWHSVFGLPNGGRELAPRDHYQYTYIRDGVTLLNVNRSGTHLGDVQLGVGWQWTPSTALRAMLKLPTGDRSDLAGGNTGGALWLDYALPFGARSGWSGYLSGGVSGNGSSGPLASLQNRVVGLGGAGIAWQAFTRAQLVGQLYLHSPLYKDTDISGLSKAGGQLLLGVNVRVGPAALFKLAFQEDVLTNSSPDFSLHLGLGF